MTQADSPSFKRVLQRNLLLPLAVSALLVAIFLAVVFYILNAGDLVARQDAQLEHEAETLKLIVDAETGLRGFLLTGREQFLEPFRNGATVPARLKQLRAEAQADPEQALRLDAIERNYSDWITRAENAIAARRRSAQIDVEELESRKKTMDEIRAPFAEFRRKSQSIRDELASRAAENARLIAFIVAIVTLALGAILALIGRRQIFQLSTSYESALAAEAEQNAKLSHQAWVRTGQLRLAESVRGESTSAELGTRLLRFLSEYTNARIGAVYVYDGGKELERTAELAFPKDAGQKKIRLAEGLLGEAAAAKKLRVLSDLPEDYVKVGSALGDTRPRHVALLPLTADGDLQGMLELGFLEPISLATQRFLEESAEVAGGAIRSLVYRTRLQHLLQESQSLTEELQAQQEELRVSNEELEERTKALQQTQARLEGQHAELEQTNEQLEEQATVLEENRRILDQRNQSLEEARVELERKAKEVEAASRYKSEFLANMSHELRTPLNSSLILAKILKDNPEGNLTDEQVEFAGTIYSAGNDLLLLINDILDLSKVEAGMLEMNPERIPVRGLLESLEKVFQPVARQKGISLAIAADDKIPPTFISDRQRAEQILKNLLSNALKFTSAGSVNVTVSSNEEGIAFAVRDTGIGIDPSQREVIFEAFRQADGTTSRKYGGTGLGLSISRTLAELLGGTITVDSRLGEGSTFTLTLPLRYSKPEVKAAAEIPAVTKPAAHAPAHREIKPHVGVPKRSQTVLTDDRATVQPGNPKVLLIVEDEPEYATILYGLVKEHGFQCILSGETEEGFTLAKEFRPAAILLDIRLPDGSGLTLLDRLKNDSSTRHIPVYGMSVADYSREALHLGAAGFSLKEGDMEGIHKILALIQARSGARAKKVLVVEDDVTQRRAVEKLISAKGVEITGVDTGSGALEALREGLFDCMVIDLKLPDMTGFELLEAMTEQKGSAIPPVIVYTGKQLTRDEEQNLYRYSRTIIIKGARSPERLLDNVTLFLHQPESELPPEGRKMLAVSRNRERSFEGRTILIADDDVRNIFALTSALELKGAKVAIARNGREAIEQLEKDSSIELVLMDVMMPEMDGLEATRAIRKESKRSDVPIIAVTAKAMRDDYERCLQAGANDYLAKPVDMDKLIGLIRVWLPKHTVLP